MTMTVSAPDVARVNGSPPPPATPTHPPAKIEDHGGAVPAAPAPRTDNATRWTYGTLIALAALVVLGAFGLSYHGLYEFGRVIVHLPHEGALVVPIALDVFSLVAMFAAFLTHDAPWKVRAYCWGIVIATVGVSVVANAIYAWYVLETEGDTKYAVAAVSLAALWPILTALSLHLIIVARRHLARRRQLAEAAAQVEVQRTETADRARAVVMAYEGQTVAAIAAELGIPERTAARWTEVVRNSLAALATSSATLAEAPTSPAPAGAANRRRRTGTTTSSTKG